MQSQQERSGTQEGELLESVGMRMRDMKLKRNWEVLEKPKKCKMGEEGEVEGPLWIMIIVMLIVPGVPY